MLEDEVLDRIRKKLTELSDMLDTVQEKQKARESESMRWERTTHSLGYQSAVARSQQAETRAQEKEQGPCFIPVMGADMVTAEMFANLKQRSRL